MDPNANPVGSVPTPTPTGASGDASGDAAQALGNLANELNNYDPATDPNLAAGSPEIAQAVANDPTVNPAGLAAAAAAEPMPMQMPMPPETSPLDAIQPIAPDMSGAAAPEMAAPEMAAPGVAATELPGMDAGPQLAAPSPDLAAAGVVGPAGGVGPAAVSVPPTIQPSDTIGQTDQEMSMPNPGDMTGAADVTGMPANSMDPMSQLAANQTPAPQEVPTGPIQAAPPVPGSIGSAKSYADIQREEAARQAKAAAGLAAQQNGAPKKKISTTTLILIIAAALVLIVVGIVMAVSLNSGSSTPQNKPSTGSSAGNDQPQDIETLICSVEMDPSMYAGMTGVLSAKRVNTFTFTDEVLSAIKIEQIYYTDSTQSAIANKEGYDIDHPTTDEKKNSTASSKDKDASSKKDTSSKDKDTSSKDEDDEELDEEDEDYVDGTDVFVDESSRSSMETITTTTSGATYTFARYVGPRAIDSWLSSSFYDPTEFNITVGSGFTAADYNTINDFKTAQNAAGMTCTITEE